MNWTFRLLKVNLSALNKIKNVQAVRLDVTIQEEVNAAVETIREAGRGLYGLVNNAGVASGGPLIEIDEADVRWLFDVNVFGVLKVTQAFAPLIINSKGRIVTIGSISGIGTWFGGGDYTMSKHAIEAFSDTLAMEMASFGVKVSVIQPGNYNSKIAKSAQARRDAKWAIDASIKRLVQRNEQQEHAFNRKELIEMLDQAIATENSKKPNEK